MNKSYFTRKEQITLSTIELINELGINGLSIHELAKKENITEGALYRHFKSKNEMIIEAIRYSSRFDINIFNTINKNNLDAKSSIIYLFTSITEYYENYPEITAISNSLQSLIYEPDIWKEVVIFQERRVDFLNSLIEKGQQSGEFTSTIDSEDLTDIISGSFSHLVYKWRIKEYNFPLKNKWLEMLNIIFKSAI